MTTEKNLPPVNITEATRYAAGKIAEYALFHQKGHRPVDFNRPSAAAEQELIAMLSISDLGSAALFQLGKEDTYVHIDSLS